MSRKKQKNSSTSNKLYSFLNIGVAAGGLIVAILGVIYVQKQYLVAQQSIEATPMVQYKRSFGGRDIEIRKDDLCQDSNGEIRWDLETFAFFDVSNLGNKPISLIQVFQRQMYIGDQIHPEIKLWFQTYFFGSRDNFNIWLGEQLENWYQRGYDSSSYEFSRPPITIPPGDTRRMVEKTSIFVRIQPNITLLAATDHLRQMDIKGGQGYEFTDDIVVTVDYTIWGEWLFGYNSPTIFQSCGH
jgi:hypothetical protein